ncbi:MAG: helix-turn-helix domain-containing protein [Pseudomonadota bacterium]
MNDEILTRKTASDFLKLNKRTLDYLVTTDQIPYSRLGKRCVRFDQGRLREWLRERENVPYRLERRATA